MGITEKFLKALGILRIKGELNGVDNATLKRWEHGVSSPTLKTFEELCTVNNIEQPFFFDGNIETLVAFNKMVCDKKGFKLQLIFEK